MHIVSKLPVAAAPFAAASIAIAQDRVVCHMDGGLAQPTKGVRNIRNHLDGDPKAKVVVVAHAESVDFLLEGAKTTGDSQEFAALAGDLMSRGVTFEICEITRKNRNLKEEQFILGPTFTPSGVVRTANLQAREQHAYSKP